MWNPSVSARAPGKYYVSNFSPQHRVLCHSPFFSTLINAITYNHRNSWNPMAISDTRFSGPTQIRRQAAPGLLGTEANLALLHPRAGPSSSGPATERSGSQSLQPSCTAPPLREGKHYGGPEKRQRREPITAEGSPQQAPLRGGVINHNWQPERPIALSETTEGRVRGAHRAVKAPRAKGPRTWFGLQLFSLSIPSSPSRGCWSASLPANYGRGEGRRQRRLNPPDRPDQWQRAGGPDWNLGSNPFGKENISPFRDRKDATHVVDHNRLVGDHIVGLHGRRISPSEEGSACRVRC